MKSIIVPQKKRGRPKTGETPRVGIRMEKEITKAIDAYRDGLSSPVSQSEAIRMLIVHALKDKGHLPK